MACWGPDAPDRRNYGKEMAKTMQAQVKLAPELYASEKQFQPLYADLSNETLRRFLFGEDGQGGMMESSAEASRQLQQIQQENTSAQRTADVADIENLGSRATDAILGANPYQKPLLDKLNAQANQGLELGSQLDPETLAMIRRSVLGQAGGNGWGYDPTDMAAVGMSTGLQGEQLRSTRQQQALQTLGANQSVIGDPFLQILGRPSGASAMLPGMLGMGQQQTNSLGPQMFNPESAYAGNLYGSNQAYDWQYKQATPSTVGRVGMVSDMVGSFIGKVAGGAMCWVAREVFGKEDPRWLVFRDWLLHAAPAWFCDLYLLHGEDFATWLRDKPRIKALLRVVMGRIVARRMKEIYAY